MTESHRPAARDRTPEPARADAGARDRMPELMRGWFDSPEPQVWTRFLFLRFLGMIYAFAFWALVRQARPLIGSDGLLPAADFLERVRAHFASGALAFWRLPTLFWLGASDSSLMLCAWLGFALALVVLFGFANAPLLAVLWALYLSFVHVGQIFYGYGWESLLCETGFLAIFIAPAWSLRPFDAHVPRPLWVLLRWLVFRVMFGAGLIKIRGDSCWTDLTCLIYHYETQPLPNPLSAFFHHLPRSVQQAAALFNHFVELVVPFGVFGPKSVRRAAGALIVLFQSILIASGNLSFLNWLTITIAIACFDDELIKRMLPKRLRERARPAAPQLSRPRRIAVGTLVVLIGVLSLNPLVNLLSTRQAMNASFDPFDLVNTYGAFGSVNRERHEVVIEGTADAADDPGARWLAYELPCKPGDPGRRPCLAAPYQYRLDWQLWFAAFEQPEDQPWLIHLLYKLLRGEHTPDVLFASNPFPEQPPRFVRARYYRYRFASAGAHDVYWERELRGEYLRPLSLSAPTLLEYVERHAWTH